MTPKNALHNKWLRLVSYTATLCFLCISQTFAGPVFTDPVGDTFGSGPVQLDITSVTSNLTVTDLTFIVDFATPIASPSAFAPNSVVGFIDIDTDQNATTGQISNVTTFGQGASGLGIEFSVDLFSEAFNTGFVDIIDTSTFFPTGTASIVFNPNSFSVSVPLSLLGSDDGLVNYDVIAGTFTESTDELTNARSATASVPVPSSLVLFSITLLGVIAYARKRVN